MRHCAIGPRWKTATEFARCVPREAYGVRGACSRFPALRPTSTAPASWTLFPATTGFARFVCGVMVLILSLVGGCGFVPTESKLGGAWQVDLQRPTKIVYAFQKDHTYTMTISAQSGAIHGKWKLEGNLLTLTMGSFVAQGMTNPLPVIKGMSTQKNVVVRLTDSNMTWRTGFLGGRLKFKRLAAPAPAEAAAR